MVEIPKALRIDQIPPVDEPLQNALKAFARGKATPNQQKLVFLFIARDLCATTVHPKCNINERESAFTDGKRWVGTVLVELTGAEVYRWRDEGTV